MKAFIVEVWRRFFNLVKASDSFLFCMFTLGGSRDGEYASSSAWNQRCKGRWHGFMSAAAIDCIFYLLFRERSHCEQSWHGQKHLYKPTESTQ